jgi:hypothetical protein
MIGGLAVVGLFARIDVAEVPAAAEQICCTAIVRFCAHKSRPMPEPHLSWPASQSCHQCQVARAMRVVALRAPSGPVEASASAVRPPKGACDAPPNARQRSRTRPAAGVRKQAASRDGQAGLGARAVAFWHAFRPS